MTVRPMISRYLTIATIGGMGALVGLWTRIDGRAESTIHSQALSPDSRTVSNSPHTSFAAIAETQRPTSAVEMVRESSSEIEPNGIDVTGGGISESSNNLSHSFRSSGSWLPSIAEPISKADLACSIDGPILTIYVHEGEIVEQGQRLALIDNRVAAANVAAAEAAASREAILTSARVKVTLAEQYLQRLQAAAEKNAASGLELDEAKSRLEEALSQVEEGLELQREAKARLLVEIARLDSHEIVAPFNGTVVKVHKHVGESIGRDEVVISLVNVERLRAELYIPIDRLNLFQRDHQVELVAMLPNHPHITGTVVHIDPIVDAVTNTVRALIEIDNSQQRYPAGFSFQVLLPEIPETAHTADLKNTR